MAITEGVGIKAPSKKSIRLAGNLGASTPIKNYGGKFQQDFGAGRIKEVRPKPGFTLKDVYGAKADTTRPNFFSPGGGAFDERNNVQVASASGDFSGTFNQTDFNSYVKGLGIKRPKALPPTIIHMLKQN